MRSSTEPTQRVAGHAATATAPATANRSSPAAAQLPGAQARELGAGPALEPALDQVAQRLAPEAHSRAGRQARSTPRSSSPPRETGAASRARRPKRRRATTSTAPDSRGLGETDPRFSDPGGQGERRKAEQHGGQEDRERPGESELGQADFGEKAAEDRKKRALLGGGPVVLHVAAPGIEDRTCRNGARGPVDRFRRRSRSCEMLPCRRLSRGGACAIAPPRRDSAMAFDRSARARRRDRRGAALIRRAAPATFSREREKGPKKNPGAFAPGPCFNRSVCDQK